MTSTLANFKTDTWVKASWDKFIAVSNSFEYEHGKLYYLQGYLKIEMAALGARHGRQNSVISYLVTLFAVINNIPIVQFVNTSYRQTGLGL